MAKTLSISDFDFDNIGTKFELDEVVIIFEQEEVKDENGNIRMNKEGKPITKDTDTIIGHNYFVTILDGQFKKKSVQVKVLDPIAIITNEEIMNRNDVPVEFDNLKNSFSGKIMYYKADKIKIVGDKKKIKAG